MLPGSWNGYAMPQVRQVGAGDTRAGANNVYGSSIQQQLRTAAGQQQAQQAQQALALQQQKQQQQQQQQQQAAVRQYVPFQDSVTSSNLQKLLRKYAEGNGAAAAPLQSVARASPRTQSAEPAAPGGGRTQSAPGAQYLPVSLAATGQPNGHEGPDRQNERAPHQPATRSALSPRRANGRAASAPNYPRDDSDVREPPFVPAEDYQLKIHQTAAHAMNNGDWQNLMVNADGSYQKHEPWSTSWIQSRGYIRAWLEFQAQSDEDLRACKELPGVREHTHHNEVIITQHKNVPDHPKLRRGRCLRWADEDELPERAKKPTTPRDPRAFADRPSQSINQPSTAPNVPSTYGTPAPGGSLSAGVARAGSGASSSGEGRRPSYQASSADNMLSHGASGHSNTSDADMARRASRDSALVALSRAHHHRLRLPWGERQRSELSSKNLCTARLDLSVLSSRATPAGPGDLGALGSAMNYLQLGNLGASGGQTHVSSKMGGTVGGGGRTTSVSDPLGLSAGGIGGMRDTRDDQSSAYGSRVVLHF